MPSLKVSVEHDLGREAAAERLRRFLEGVKSQYEDKLSHLEEEWDEFRGSFKISAMGIKSEGAVTIEEKEVRVDGKIPIAAVIFKGKIEETIRTYLEKVLR